MRDDRPGVSLGLRGLRRHHMRRRRLPTSTARSSSASAPTGVAPPGGADADGTRAFMRVERDIALELETVAAAPKQDWGWPFVAAGLAGIATFRWDGHL